MDRLDVSDEIADSHTSLAGLLPRDAEGHASGVVIVAAEHGDGVKAVELCAELAAGGFPIKGGGDERRARRHGLPSYTQYECPDSRPARSASSLVRYGPSTTR